MNMQKTSTLPRHIGLILDGNRRWASAQGLRTLDGHKKGYENLKDIAQVCFDKGIPFVSAFVFSTENWNRSKEEVGYLMDLAVKVATKDTKELVDNNIRIMMMGSREGVPKKVLDAFDHVVAESAQNTGGTLSLCFNYGGHKEITDAMRRVIDDGLRADEITDESITQRLYCSEVPEIDFLIRTSGEQRISNFMLWRIAYAELYFTDCHWPAFDTTELDNALAEFARRSRRFGGN